MEKSIINTESFKDKMSVSKFSTTDKMSIPESHLLAKYSDMMKKKKTHLREKQLFQVIVEAKSGANENHNP